MMCAMSTGRSLPLYVKQPVPKTEPSSLYVWKRYVCSGFTISWSLATMSALFEPFSSLTKRVTIWPPCLKPAMTSAYSSPSISTVSGDCSVGRSTRSYGAGQTFGVSLW